MFRNFISDPYRNLVKILGLSIGLAVGLTLLGDVWSELTKNSYLKDADRIYCVTEKVYWDQNPTTTMQTPGRIGSGLKHYVPQVEEMVRILDCRCDRNIITTADGRELEHGGIALADSSLFDVLHRDILAGNPHEVLSVSGRCMIPASLAGKIGGDVIGGKLSGLPDGNVIEIGGVYEDFPDRSTVRNLIYVAMTTEGTFWGGANREAWIGADNYKTYIRLMPGVAPDSVKPYIRKMLEDNIRRDELDIRKFDIGLQPIKDSALFSQEKRTELLVFSILAILVILIVSLNYLLVTMSQVQLRMKEMAVRKTCGMDRLSIFGLVMGESVMELILSLVLAAVILHYTVSLDIFMVSTVWAVVLSVCAGVLCITGVVPAWIYSRTPVTNALHVHSRYRMILKRMLLAVQVLISAFVFCFLILIGRQLSMIRNIDMGYEYENVGYVYLGDMPCDDAVREKVLDSLRKLGYVEMMSTADADFTGSMRGISIWDDELGWENRVLVNMIYANPEIFETLGLQFIQGIPFSSGQDMTHAVVERRMIDVMHDYFDVEGAEVVGNGFTMQGQQGNRGCEISGVVNDMYRGSFISGGLHAGVIFLSSSIMDHLYIRFHAVTPESMYEAQAVLDGVSSPDMRLEIVPLSLKVEMLSSDIESMMKYTGLYGMIALAITLTGLIGYVVDDMQSRTKEIAIRRVNGMGNGDIIRMVCGEISLIAIPAMALGCLGSLGFGRVWLSRFSEQVSLWSPAVIAGMVVLWAVVIVVAVICCRSVAYADPVRYLSNE